MTASPATAATPIRLHDFTLSGHSHRARLMLSLLGLPHEIVPVDLAGGEQRTPAFLALNPFGQVPVLVDGDVTVADSNAILVYLALRHDPDRRWLPADPAAQAAVQRWLSVAAGELARGPAAARVSALFRQTDDAAARAAAGRLFATLEAWLEGRDWLAAAHPTIADVALYSYTAHAPEGGCDLAPHPRLCAWLKRVEALPGFVALPASPRPAA